MARNVSAASSELRHPTPDLHVLHCAHFRNVQKLERSAEELSSGGSDIAEEIRKMNELSRQSSLQSSQHGDFSVRRPTVAERRTPLQPSLAMSAESKLSREPSQSSFAARYDAIAAQIHHSLQHVPPSPPKHRALPPERPRSTDTLEEAQVAFKDFDGVHFSPDTNDFIQLDEDGNEIRRVSASSSAALSLHAANLLRAPHVPPASQVMPPPGEGMLYYPAPVPKLLNLPKRLSQLPAATVQSKRRSDLLYQMSQDAGAAAPWLSTEDIPLGGVSAARLPRGSYDYNDAPSKRMSASTVNLAPQARAELFFKHQSIPHDVQLESGSAVATLDSILAASATAPVHSFTDHPFAGDVRQSVYSAEHKATKSVNDLSINSSAVKKRRSVSMSGNVRRAVSSDAINTLSREGGDWTSTRSGGFHGEPSTLQERTSRMSLGGELDEQADGRSRFVPSTQNSVQGTQDLQGSHPASIVGDDDLRETDEAFNASQDPELLADPQEDGGEPTYVKPSTLLAELQVRKAQLKSRSRTAATAFPNGMHSTLLQLDAVEETAKRNRRGQRIGLAWEDPQHRVSQRDVEAADEDVPLGMLFPSKDGQTSRIVGDGKDWDRPLGLLERRRLEDTEPLSSRRSRLRGVSPGKRRSPGSQLNAPGNENAEADEHETLAQRLRRMKLQNASGTNVGGLAPPIADNRTSELAQDVLSNFTPMDMKGDGGGGKQEPSPKPTPSPVPEEEEETLGQRRARLKREREAGGDPRKPAEHRNTGSTYEPAQGTLLQANAEVAARQRMQLQSTNLRASSHHLDRPLVDARPTYQPASRGLLASGDSRASVAGLSAYNNGMGGIQLPPNPTFSTMLGTDGTTPYFASTTAAPYGYAGVMGHPPMQNLMQTFLPACQQQLNAHRMSMQSARMGGGGANGAGMMNTNSAAPVPQMNGMGTNHEQLRPRPHPQPAAIDGWRLGVQ